MFEAAEAVEGAEVIVAGNSADGEGELMTLDRFPFVTVRSMLLVLGIAILINSRGYSRARERPETGATLNNCNTKMAGSRRMVGGRPETLKSNHHSADPKTLIESKENSSDRGTHHPSSSTPDYSNILQRRSRTGTQYLSFQ